MTLTADNPSGETATSSVAPIYPAARRTRYLPALTPAELRELPAKESALVIIPVGAIEQHGAHLPVGVDAMIGEAACDGLHTRLPADAPVWFGPTLTFGKSNEHTGFPGTISLSARTLRRHVRALVNDLHGHGFRQFALLNTHGGKIGRAHV